MEHRHINLAPGEWPLAAVESLYERGSDSDVWQFIGLVVNVPYGQAAESALAAEEVSEVYGLPKLVANIIKRTRRTEKHARKRQGL